MNVTGDIATLDPLLRAVQRGDLTDQRDVVHLRDVIRASAWPAPAGSHWVLRMTTAERSCTLHMLVAPDEVLPALQGSLGERLSLAWWNTSTVVKWVQTVWFWAVISVATLGIIVVVAFFFGPSGEMPAWLAMWGAAAAVLGIGTAYLPGALLRAWSRWRTPRLPATD
jgi:hypothetical protein